MSEMRAMVLSQCGKVETNPLELRRIERHRIRNPSEILIKIEACGVCHSQIHGIEGDWLDIGIPPVLPTVPGHELVGRVEEVGNAVTKFKVGDRAGMTPLLSACGECQYCAEGNEQLCDSMEVTGETLRGGYAEYITVPEKFATKIPPGMKSEYAAPLFCAGITAYKAVKAAEPQTHHNIGIFGIGGVGHMAVQFAALEGCHIVAVSRNRRHLDMAKKLGAAATVRYEGGRERLLATIRQDHGLLDAAIVFAPSDEVTDAAIRAVKKGGLVVIATIGENPHFKAFEEKTIRGTLIGSTKDMEEVIKIAGEKGLEVVHESFPLEKANEVLQMLKESKIEARAVLVP
ncbi:MAG: alcohol dehydrogenase catalytic domain-containing protein [Nitrosopumilaceae archaeon]|nr:alcohol dehydrogenase catalytic domain-containing protein [Nitrosopumilaceae archaeon]